MLISFPLIVMSFGVLIHSVYRASSLLIQVKRRELGIDKRDATRRNAERKTKESSASSSGVSKTTTTTRVQAADEDVDGDAPPTGEAAATTRQTAKQRKSTKGAAK